MYSVTGKSFNNSRGWRPLKCSVAMTVCAVLLFGCSVPRQVRSEHVAQYSEALAKSTERALPPGAVLALDDCIGIALENSLDVQAREINARLAAIDRQAAFGNFLPQVELDVSYVKSDDQQAIRAGGGYAAMSDRSVTETVLSAQQPIFVPQAWLLYSMTRRGEDVSALVTERTRQLITLQVTADYYACLSYMDMREHLEASVSQAGALLDEIRAFHREGLAVASQAEGAAALLQARRDELKTNERSLRQARARLLDTMGLSPLGEINLAASCEPVMPAGNLEDEVLMALENRLELHVSDRNIETADEKVRMAVADFLPSVVGLGGYMHSNDGYLRYADLWSYGLSGVLTVFDGFQNIADYRAARALREETFLQREQACLAIMLEVISARLQFDDACDAFDLAERTFRAHQVALDEAEALRREGVIGHSEILGAVVARDRAKAQLELSRYRRLVASATLLDVTGTPWKETDQ